jgi:NAD(P)-dependent dehydrogenase (short-subunit alcohol dehydrogenase family)
MILARTHPSLRVNACTPGFIATDLTRPYADSGTARLRGAAGARRAR